MTALLLANHVDIIPKVEYIEYTQTSSSEINSDTQEVEDNLSSDKSTTEKTIVRNYRSHRDADYKMSGNCYNHHHRTF